MPLCIYRGVNHKHDFDVCISIVKRYQIGIETRNS